MELEALGGFGPEAARVELRELDTSGTAFARWVCAAGWVCSPSPAARYAPLPASRCKSHAGMITAVHRGAHLARSMTQSMHPRSQEQLYVAFASNSFLCLLVPLCLCHYDGAVFARRLMLLSL